MLQTLFHFSILLLIAISAYGVITAKSPVDSVLFLILVFLASASLLILLEVEFIALIFLVIYVGAIAVLFLFIVMMLEIKVQEGELGRYAPIAFLLGFLFFLEISISITDLFGFVPIKKSSIPWIFKIDSLSNTELLGQALYHDFVSCFLLSGILLLIAMVGAILLTFRFLSLRRHEVISRQMSREITL